MRQNFVCIYKKHQSIADANSKEEFPREGLKNKRGEREEREKRQICAGKFGCGAGGFRACHVAEGWRFFTAFVLVEFIAVVETDAVKLFSVHQIFAPIVREFLIVEIFTVREDEGVVVLVGVLFRLLAGDPQIDLCCARVESLFDFHLRLFGVFAVKKNSFGSFVCKFKILFSSWYVFEFCCLKNLWWF